MSKALKISAFKSVFGIVLFFSCAVPILRGQAPENATPPCKPADIDTTFSFDDSPAGHQDIGIHLHNMKRQSCKLRGEITPSFAVDSHGAIVKTCWLCTADGDPDVAAIRRNNDFVLPGDGDAQVMYRWSSVGDTCQKVDWATMGVEWDGRTGFLFQNRHWKPHICSTMTISGYEPDAISSSRRTAVLKVTVPAEPVYADEFAQLKLELIPGREAFTTGEGCPELYGVYKDSTNSTRFEAILPDGYDLLVLRPTDQPSLSISSSSDELPAEFKDRIRLCATAKNRDSTTVTVPASLKAPIHVVPQPTLENLRHIVWRTTNSSTHEPVFVTADVHFDVLDPDTLPQNWGSQVEGIGAGLSVDKTTFTFGETIPLHIRWENFSAGKKLAVGECGNPPQLEIQDVSHRVLGTFTDYDMGCMGHGWGPSSLQTGKQNRAFVSISYSKMGYSSSGQPWPISQPGTYYILAVWAPSTLVVKKEETKPQPFSTGGYVFGEPYATARSLPVRIQILQSAKQPLSSQ
jgi:hypothetical protein